VVNADDFGYGAGVNRGILEAIDKGIVSYVSLMVNTPGTRDAVVAWRARPHVSLGPHANFTNGRCVLFVPCTDSGGFCRCRG
jgi:predicted glycoside hydrolase/deacetylase ChbG (UPF0249 family)